jgi:hypothetical protein
VWPLPANWLWLSNSALVSSRISFELAGAQQVDHVDHDDDPFAALGHPARAPASRPERRPPYRSRTRCSSPSRSWDGRALADDRPRSLGGADPRLVAVKAVCEGKGGYSVLRLSGT